MYQITPDDKRVIKQNQINFQVKLEVMDWDNHIINTIEGGLVSGSSNIDAESDIRRTMSITIVPEVQADMTIKESMIIWLDKKVRLSIGIKDLRTDDYRWWKAGVYLFTNTSSSYDVTTNQLTLNLSDLTTLLDGSRNGNLGQALIKYPAYEETAEGKPYKYNYIRDQLITTIGQLGRIKEYNVDWIGEAKAFPHYEKDWDYQAYRESTLVQAEDGNDYYMCFALPYDLEFTTGTSVLAIVTELKNLYENFEAYFDENGVFCCKLIPSGEDDPITLDNDFVQSILISENNSLDFTEVGNVIHAWGQTLDPDYFAESVSYSNNVYSATIQAYRDRYYNNDEFGITVPSGNTGSTTYVNINSFGNVPIYNENTETPIEAGAMTANKTYVLKIRQRRESGNTITRAYLEGQWQVQAMDVITDGTVGEPYTTSGGVTVDKYSKEYFQQVYAVDTVHMTVLPDSPFTVQKLGVILRVYENDKMTSDYLATEAARQENYRQSRLTDNINITTMIVPFLDVNQLVSYQKVGSDVPETYIVKSISHDWSACTSSITMVKYYRQYLVTSD